MKDTIMVVSVFVVTLGTGALIIWTSPLQIQAAKVFAINIAQYQTFNLASTYRKVIFSNNFSLWKTCKGTNIDRNLNWVVS